MSSDYIGFFPLWIHNHKDLPIFPDTSGMTLLSLRRNGIFPNVRFWEGKISINLGKFLEISDIPDFYKMHYYRKEERCPGNDFLISSFSGFFVVFTPDKKWIGVKFKAKLGNAIRRRSILKLKNEENLLILQEWIKKGVQNVKNK